jgi:hypothetical protein
MILSYSLLVMASHVNARYRTIAASPKVQLICLSMSDYKEKPKKGDYRLYINGKPTRYFEPESDVLMSVYSIERERTRDAYLVSTRTTDGAILAWSESYLYWNGKSVEAVPGAAGDPLEFHPDGRLLTLASFDSFASVGLGESGWEHDRNAYLILHGKSVKLGGAVNLWFERDGSIRGISNGRGEKPNPHWFTYRAGFRYDEAVSSVPLKRTSKRLFAVKGIDARY